MSVSTVVTHIFNVDNNWGTSQFPPSALTEAVQQVHFCAHVNTENTGSDGQPPTNWSMFLEIDPNRSVGVDVVPGDPHSPGMIILEMIETKDCSVFVEIFRTFFEVLRTTYPMSYLCLTFITDCDTITIADIHI